MEISLYQKYIWIIYHNIRNSMNEIASPHCQPDNAILLSVSRGQGHIDEV